MKEIDKDEVPDASGGAMGGRTPVPYIDPRFPSPEGPNTEPLGSGFGSGPLLLPSAADPIGQF